MTKKLKSAGKIVCFLLIALCVLFAACEEPAGNLDDPPVNPGQGNGDDPYNNPNAGASRDLKFSHDSGLHANPFSLTITAAEGSEIYYTTDGSIPSPNKAGTTKYSAPISVVNRNGQANVLATPANITQMNMAQDDPRGDIPTFFIPNNSQVPKATVIRAVVVNSRGTSDVITKTYFIGNNLTQYGNVRILSLVSDPYNLVDQTYGIMVRGDPANRWEGANIYNFRQRGEAWERPAHLELFEGNASSRSVNLSTGVGIRVRGGYSRGPGQKSFNVYFKEQYGINNLKTYNLIPGAVKADGRTPVDTFKSFMLRTGANDSEYGKFYDLFLQELIKDRSFSTQAGVPCIVYLNGEYWGPYNLQERYSDNHTEYKYGVKKENVISYDNGELDDGNAGEENLFLNLANGVINGSISYAEFCNAFDIDSFIDYWAAEIYINNEDWPHNNYRLWRTRTVESGNPYGDTKWRYQVFDTEFAIGLYQGGSTADAIGKILTGEHNGNINNKLFKKLMENADFSKKFVNTIMDLYNVNFHPTKFEPLLTAYTNAYRPLMGDANTPGTYFSRWGITYGSWESVFQDKVNDARRYLTDIRSVLPNQLKTHFSSVLSGSNLCNIVVASASSGVSFKVNSVTVANNWAGTYFTGVPIPVTAIAPAGLQFDSWQVTGGTAATPSASTTTVTLNSASASIIAKYTGANIVDVTGINLNPPAKTLKIGESFTITATVTPSNATFNTVTWTSSDTSVATVDTNGKVTAAINLTGGSATITATSLVGGITATCTVTVTAPTVLLDLAQQLQSTSVTVGAVNDFSAINSGLTSGFTVSNSSRFVTDDPNEEPLEVSYAIIQNGTKKLQVNEKINYGAGLNIVLAVTGDWGDNGFTGTVTSPFEAGDIIEVKGYSINGPSSGIYINKDCWGYDVLQGWNGGDGAFDKTFTLSADDVATINSNAAKTGGQAICLKRGGTPPHNGGIGDIGSFVIEQIKITRP